MKLINDDGDLQLLKSIIRSALYDNIRMDTDTLHGYADQAIHKVALIIDTALRAPETSEISPSTLVPEDFSSYRNVYDEEE